MCKRVNSLKGKKRHYFFFFAPIILPRHKLLRRYNFFCGGVFNQKVPLTCSAPHFLTLINTQKFTFKNYYAKGMPFTLAWVRLQGETESFIGRYSSFSACHDPGATSHGAGEDRRARRKEILKKKKKKEKGIRRTCAGCVTDYSAHLFNFHKHTLYANQRK